MTDIARPAQTGQYRSVSPSRNTSYGFSRGALSSFAQYCGNPHAKVNAEVECPRLDGVST
jgi:hypothetical protein